MPPRILLLALLIPSLLLGSLPARAEPIRAGERISPLAITEHGELLLKRDEVAFQPWDTDRLADGRRMHVLLYMAATLGASRINEHFTTALSAQRFPPSQVLPTTIVNVSETPWGAIGFALKELKHNKRKHPQAVLVADTRGIGRETWALQANSYAVTILDPQGTVLFSKDGALTADEVERALQLLRDGIRTLPEALPAR